MVKNKCIYYIDYLQKEVEVLIWDAPHCMGFIYN